VENLRDGSVKIVCETEEATLKKFIQAITLKTDIIAVEKVEILRTRPATGEYEFFEIKYGPLEEEMGERLVAAFTIAAATRQDIKNMHGELKDVHGELKGMHGELKDMRHDLKDMHQDLKSSINSMHDDMNRHFEEMAKRYDAISAELLRTREELKRSVDTLVELVHKFLEKS
jgi:predicted  nucleic acid-binding Zn-ribbon protein